MHGFGNWLRNLGTKMAAGYRRFMQGRYGGDKLNIALVWVSFGAYIVSLLIPFVPVKLLLVVVYYGLLGWAIFRMLSRNTYRRYQENRKYLQLVDRIKDRQHRYFDCPGAGSRCASPEAKARSPSPAPGAGRNS